jgi:hypothetical protein
VVGGSIETSAPPLTIPPDRLLLADVESTKSPLANFADGRRVRADVDVDWLSDASIALGSENGGGVGDAKVNESGVPGVFKSIVDARLWRPVVVRRRGRGREAVGVEADVVDVGVGKKAPFEPLERNCG